MERVLIMEIIGNIIRFFIPKSIKDRWAKEDQKIVSRLIATGWVEVVGGRLRIIPKAENENK